MLKAAIKIYNKMIKRVAYAPVNLYFDITPLGRILNIFSKDHNVVTCMSIKGIPKHFYNLLQVFIVAVWVFPLISIVITIMCILSYLLFKKSAKAI